MVPYMHDSVVSAADDTCPPVAWKNVLAVKELFLPQRMQKSLYCSPCTYSCRPLPPDSFFSCNIHYKSYLQAAAFAAQICAQHSVLQRRRKDIPTA